MNTLKVERPLEMSHNPECFLETLACILRANGFEGEDLVNHQWGFKYHRSARPDALPTFSAFDQDDTERMIQEVSGIRCRWSQNNDWNLFLDRLASSLVIDQPLLVMVDTFFLSNFSKRKGHLPHTLLVYGYEASTNSILVKSAVPGDWKIPLDQFRLACQSLGRIGPNPIAWMDITFPQRKVEPNLIALIKNSIMNMSGANTDDPFSAGIVALEQFANDFARWVSFADQDQVNALYRHIGKASSAVVHQRRRFAKFITQHPQINDGVREDISRLAVDWELFSNACLKLGTSVDKTLSSRIVHKLRSIVVLEKSALHALEEIGLCPATTCERRS